MMKDFDPDRFPEVSYETIRQTEQEGLRWVSVVCEDPDGAGQYLNLFVRSLPRLGEQLLLPDGTWWKVTGVAHTVVRYAEWQCLGTVPYVSARRLREPSRSASRGGQHHDP